MTRKDMRRAITAAVNALPALGYRITNEAVVASPQPHCDLERKS